MFAAVCLAAGLSAASAMTVSSSSGESAGPTSQAADVWKSKDVSNTFSDIRMAVPLAQEQLEIMARVVKTFQPSCQTWLDMGCGDGPLSRNLIQAFPRSRGVMMDFSQPMLETARQKLNEMGEDKLQHVDMVEGDFSSSRWKDIELVRDRTFDVVVSGFAIHHLTDTRKQELYREIHDKLSPGGVFLNLEHVACPDSIVEGIVDGAFVDSMYAHFQGAKTREECKAAVEYDLSVDDDANILASVESQCDWLRDIGYEHVDCYFKYLILALFGGVKKT